jgi:hypothetical protein
MAASTLITDPILRQHLEVMREFDWTCYMAGAVRHAGITGQEEEIDEKVHEIVIRMLVSPSGLFRDYDKNRHGPFDLQSKWALANALENLTEKERKCRRCPALALTWSRTPCKASKAGKAVCPCHG